MCVCACVGVASRALCVLVCQDRELASLAKSSSDRITELETQVQEQADELDLLRDDAATLAQTKSALKKAKSRLASVNDLKIVNKVRLSPAVHACLTV